MLFARANRQNAIGPPFSGLGAGRIGGGTLAARGGTVASEASTRLRPVSCVPADCTVPDRKGKIVLA
jgi:hypothetical protein